MSTGTPAVRRTTLGLPTTIGLIVALAGPFLVQFVLAPLMLQSSLRPTTAVLLSQGMLWVLAGMVIAISRGWEHKPWSWIGLRPITWPMVLLAGALGVVLVFAVTALTAAVNRLMPPSAGGTVDSVASGAPAWLLLIVVLTASVTEELLFRAYPIEHLARLTGKRWPGALLSLAAFVALHLASKNPSKATTPRGSP